jgi:hypothetical protein
MAAEPPATGDKGEATEGLAVVLAAVAELESEAVTSKRGGRAPHAADVVKRLEQVGVTLDHDGVVRAMRAAVDELGLATGVFTVDQDGRPDARSLHVTMAGVRWLRSQVRPSQPGEQPQASSSQRA